MTLKSSTLKIQLKLTVVLFATAFVMWANSELQNFVVRFSRQVFHRNIGLSAVGVCVGIASENCEKVVVGLIVFCFSINVFV